ncbi:uncharacterized protein LOC142356460, partial [Convolutriloba macropyga]|uniref:uncharacterized protein LOC142356460 n=1 Tax=Convolutriloba macropyga TaxID=536237 RepID=UPI003F52538A
MYQVDRNGVPYTVNNVYAGNFQFLYWQQFIAGYNELRTEKKWEQKFLEGAKLGSQASECFDCTDEELSTYLVLIFSGDEDSKFKNSEFVETLIHNMMFYSMDSGSSHCSIIIYGREKLITIPFTTDRSSLLTKMRNALKPTSQKRVATFNQAMRGARGQIEPRDLGEGWPNLPIARTIVLALVDKNANPNVDAWAWANIRNTGGIFPFYISTDEKVNTGLLEMYARSAYFVRKYKNFADFKKERDQIFYDICQIPYHIYPVHQDRSNTYQLANIGMRMPQYVQLRYKSGKVLSISFSIVREQRTAFFRVFVKCDGNRANALSFDFTMDFETPKASAFDRMLTVDCIALENGSPTCEEFDVNKDESIVSVTVEWIGNTNNGWRNDGLKRVTLDIAVDLYDQPTTVPTTTTTTTPTTTTTTTPTTTTTTSSTTTSGIKTSSTTSVVAQESTSTNKPDIVPQNRENKIEDRKSAGEYLQDLTEELTMSKLLATFLPGVMLFVVVLSTITMCMFCHSALCAGRTVAKGAAAGS